MRKQGLTRTSVCLFLLFFRFMIEIALVSSNYIKKILFEQIGHPARFSKNLFDWIR